MNRSLKVTLTVVFAPCFFVLCFSLLGTACSKKTHTSLDDAQQSSVSDKPAASQEKPPEDLTYTTVDWTDLLPDDDLHALENPPEYLAEIEDGSEADRLASRLKSEPSGESNIAKNNTTKSNAINSHNNESDNANSNASVSNNNYNNDNNSNNDNSSNNDSNSRDSVAEDRYQQALSSEKIRPEFDGRAIRIPGFIVPLEFDDDQTITTFFLVPFFGACIHLPPPPPNQIIYAHYKPGVQLEALYDPFWVNGMLSTKQVENELATAAYSIAVSSVEPYYNETAEQKWGEAPEVESPE